MGRKIRIRCPICGMLTWQSRLDQEWEFEIVLQRTKGRGRGRGFSNEYSYPEKEQGTFLVKLAMADKLEAVARKLREEARSEKDDTFWETLREGRWRDATAVGRAAGEAAFDTIESRISGIAGMQLEFFTVSTPAAALYVDAEYEEAGAGAEGYEEYEDADSHILQETVEESAQPRLIFPRRLRYISSSKAKGEYEDEDEAQAGTSAKVHFE